MLDNELVTVKTISPSHTHYHLTDSRYAIAKLAACIYRETILRKIEESPHPRDVRVIAISRPDTVHVFTRDEAVNGIVKGTTNVVLNCLPIGYFGRPHHGGTITILDPSGHIVWCSPYEKDPNPAFLSLCADVPEEFQSNLLDALLYKYPAGTQDDFDSDSMVKNGHIVTVVSNNGRFSGLWMKYSIYNVDTRKETTISIGAVPSLA